MPYTYLWEFRVRPERRTEFEGHYGPTGSWVALFRRAPGYLETLLLQDRVDELRYVTIDRWQSLEAYRAFRARFAEDYEALDRSCEGMTTHEAPLGEFNGG